MGFFDRFTSRKGKDQTTGPKRGVVKATKEKDAEKKAFAAVPSATDEKVTKNETKGEARKTVQSRPASTVDHPAHRFLLRPVVTEKSTRGGSLSQYTFDVATSATKSDVQQSIHHLYGVTPIAINIMTIRGKQIRFGRTFGRTMKRKKAIVTLPAGKTIDVVSA